MFLAFDIGGSFIKYAEMTQEGEILEKGKIPTPVRPGQGVTDLTEALGSIYDVWKEKVSVEGIAIGLPGQVDVEQGIVYGGGALKYMDKIPLAGLISKRCDGVRVSLENDGKCAALAEVWKGNAKDATDACVLVFGTGIGGGIIKNRKVYRGRRLLAGEISYMIENMTMDQLHDISRIEDITIEESYEKMPYLWGTKSSSNALVYRVAQAKGMEFSKLSGELIYQWAQEGDSLVKELLEEVYFSIAKQCCNLYVTLDPDIILIGGGISAQPAFIEGIQKYVDKLKQITKVYDELKIDVCKFRNDSNLLGALYNYLQMYEDGKVHC